MKRLFILATAATVALASCTKTQVVYNEAPQEIGFKAVTGVMTKAGVQTLGDNNTMGVFANLSSGKSPYFGNTCFAPVQVPTGDYEWVASPKKYWPLDGTLDFAVYSPFVAGNETVVRAYADSPAANSLVIKVDNSNFADQTDWLYGTTILTGQRKNNTAMAVTLRHPLSKITVSVTSDLVGLVITELKVSETHQVGTLTVNYANSDSDGTDTDERLLWTENTSTTDMVIASDFITTVETKNTSATYYLIPSDQTSIVMTYKLTDDSPELTYTHPLNGNSAQWIDGKHYTYNINITANEIKFDPTETAWDNVTPSSSIVTDPNDAIPANQIEE